MNKAEQVLKAVGKLDDGLTHFDQKKTAKFLIRKWKEVGGKGIAKNCRDTLMDIDTSLLDLSKHNKKAKTVRDNMVKELSEFGKALNAVGKFIDDLEDIYR